MLYSIHTFRNKIVLPKQIINTAGPVWGRGPKKYEAYMLWISTNCLTNSSLDVALESIGKLTHGVEIVDAGKHRIPSISELESFPYKYSIRLTQPEINLASILEPIRQASVAVVTEKLCFASEVFADVIIDSGYVSSGYDLILAKKQLAKSILDLNRASDEYGVSFLLRNMGRSPNYLIRKPEDLTLISNVPLALDIGNANVNGCLPQMLSDAGSRYVYLYDNKGIDGRHLDIRRGSINFEQVSSAMYANGARGVVDMPTFRSAHNTLKALRQFGIS